ncbi:hypothetical protein LCGC14_0369960 [marine sediment metagenome]|uniref:Uncharacterized protein n=1 Tax=marine sediment metagenome TaxID=412755 RepID=A0A0F9TNJ2_9ZZZZ
MKPTDEELRRFWEFYGLHYTVPYWVDDNDNLAFYGETHSELLKSINLTILFQYAVPVLDFWLASKEKSKRVGVQVQYHGKLLGLVFDETFEDALFWALDKVRETI